MGTSRTNRKVVIMFQIVIEFLDPELGWYFSHEIADMTQANKKYSAAAEKLTGRLGAKSIQFRDDGRVIAETRM